MQKKCIIHFKGSDKQSVLLEFHASKLIGKSELFSREIRYEDLSLEIGGANNHLYFLRPLNSHDSYLIQLPIDREIKMFFYSLDQPRWTNVLMKHKRHHWYFSSLVLICVLTCALLFYGLLNSRSFLASKVVELIPYETEVAIGERLLPIIVPPNKKIIDEELQRELEAMLAPLQAVVPLEYKDFNFYISRDKELNAFAMPGGNIVINRGLLERAETDPEVLGVVAHEMAHVTERHVLRNMIQGTGLFLIIQTLFGDMSGLIAVLSDQGAFLLNQSFSREMESEADRIGLDFLVAAKIPLYGLVEFFRKIQQEHEKKLGNEIAQLDLSILSTHPNIEKRIESILEMIENHGVIYEYDENYLSKIQVILKDR